jgi:hypothetical protein
MLTSEKITVLLDTCKELSNNGSITRYDGMTYEEGIIAALEWVLCIIPEETDIL